MSEEPETWGIFETDLVKAASQVLELYTTIWLSNTFDPLKWQDARHGVHWGLRLGAALRGPLHDARHELAAIRPTPYDCIYYPHERSASRCMIQVGWSVYNEITRRLLGGAGDVPDDSVRVWEAAIERGGLDDDDFAAVEPLIEFLDPGPRLMLLRTNRWLAALVREASWEVERAGYERTKISRPLSPLAPKKGKKRGRKPNASNEARDKWIYEEMMKRGTSMERKLKLILIELKTRCATHGWGMLGSEQTVSKAGLRYARNHKPRLPEPE